MNATLGSDPQRPRILVVHVDFSAAGGAEAYAHAVVDQLKQRGFRVDQLDVAGLTDADGVFHPCWWSRWVLSVPGLKRMSLVKYALACRHMKGLADRYDLVLGSYGELPSVDQPMIRILHAPVMFSANEEALSYLGVVDKSRAHVLGRQLYATMLRWLAGVDLDPKSGSRVVTIVNSRWTEGVVQRLFGQGEFSVVYPKVTPPAVPPASVRDPNRFIAIGRIVPNKRLEDAVHIVGKVREQGADAQLTIIGRATSDYARQFVDWAAQFPYVTVITDASQAQMVEALSTSTYGLHCYRHEHFGISVAEMCAAGVVPFVFDGGGVAELVPFQALRFSSVDDAATKIGAVLESPLKLPEYRQVLAENPVLSEAVAFDDRFQQVLLQSVQRLGVPLPPQARAAA